MRSRFIARMTDIAFQASPPRGVGMLRLVSPSAISRYGLPRIASTTGFSLDIEAEHSARPQCTCRRFGHWREGAPTLLGLSKRTLAFRMARLPTKLWALVQGVGALFSSLDLNITHHLSDPRYGSAGRCATRKSCDPNH